MSNKNKCVVRNAQYRRGGLSVRERHNERKNADYMNEDIIKSRAELNYYFKKSEGSYENIFNKMVEDKTISLRGLGKDPFIVDELVFDVNTEYFESKGGYEYAKKFFEEAYNLAVKEVGGEEYILSAVMHADEKNRALSEQLGRDVYHYHLHVVYVPVVDKEIKWSKRCKDPVLVGTTKEIIKQVSHSKKWSRYKENGKWINSYSLLQDRFFEHMQAAGFTDFERGERGSTAEHLSVLEYKNKKEQERLEKLKKETKATKQTAATFSDIESMVQKNMFGKLTIAPEDWNKVLGLAKNGIIFKGEVSDLKEKLKISKEDVKKYRSRWEKLHSETRDIREASRRFPEKVNSFIKEVLLIKPHEKQELFHFQGQKRNGQEIC